MSMPAATAKASSFTIVDLQLLQLLKCGNQCSGSCTAFTMRNAAAEVPCAASSFNLGRIRVSQSVGLSCAGWLTNAGMRLGPIEHVIPQPKLAETT
jgi:hypothetical protein